MAHENQSHEKPGEITHACNLNTPEVEAGGSKFQGHSAATSLSPVLATRNPISTKHNTYAHTDIHAYTHTYVHTYTHTDNNSSKKPTHFEASVFCRFALPGTALSTVPRTVQCHRVLTSTLLVRKLKPKVWGRPKFTLGMGCTWVCTTGRLTSTPVMANLGCQLDHTWNQLKPKLLGMPARDILNQMI